MEFVALYFLVGLSIALLRIAALRRMGLAVVVSAATWAIVVAIWPFDLVLSVWKLLFPNQERADRNVKEMFDRGEIRRME